MNAPRLSVIVTVYNAGTLLDAALESVVAQTHTDFELVIFDDASTDDSPKRIAQWAERDSRVRVVTSERNLGVVHASNAAVAESRGDIVARMDQDDLSHPDRLRRQLAVLDADPEVVLVGTLSDGIDLQGRLIRSRDRSRLLRRSPFPPFPHASIMFRRAAFEHIGGYRAIRGWEDVDLFLRMRAVGRVVTLPEALYRYRYHGSWTATEDLQHAARTVSLQQACFAELRASGSYETALAAPAPMPTSSQRAQAAATLAVLAVWGGTRPRVKLPWRDAAASGLPVAGRLLACGLLGRASPSALRRALSLGVALRDRRAGRHIADGVPVEWTCAITPAESNILESELPA